MNTAQKITIAVVAIILIVLLIRTEGEFTESEYVSGWPDNNVYRTAMSDETGQAVAYGIATVIAGAVAFFLFSKRK